MTNLTDTNIALIVRKLESKLARQRAAVAETEQHIEAMRNMQTQQDIERSKPRSPNK